MTVSTTLLNTGSSVAIAPTTLAAVDKADFALADSISKEDGTREAIYQNVAGSAEYPMTVRVGFYKNAKANDGLGSTSVSVKISSFVQKTDVDDVIWTHPAHFTLAFVMPGGTLVPDASDVQEMLGHLFSWLIPHTANVPGTEALDELKYGVTAGLLSHANTAA